MSGCSVRKIAVVRRVLVDADDVGEAARLEPRDEVLADEARGAGDTTRPREARGLLSDRSVKAWSGRRSGAAVRG